MKKLMMITMLCLLSGSFLFAENAPAGTPGTEPGPAARNDNDSGNPPPPPPQNSRGRQMRPGQGMPGEEMGVPCPNCMMQDRPAMPMDFKRQHGQPDQEMMDKRLAETDPKKFEEISRLREQVKEITRQLMEKSRKDEEDFKKLADKYRETKSDVDKAALKAKLEERMKNSLEAQKQHLADEEENLQTKVDKILGDIASGRDGRKEKRAEQPEHQ